MGSLVETLAQALADLRLVRPSQWALRLLGLVALLAADALALGGALGSAGGVAVSVLVALLGLWQSARPDADAGLVALGLVLLAVLATGPSGLPATLAIAALLLVAHGAWALATLVPAYGVVRGGAWRAHGRALLPALAVGLAAGAVLLLASSTGAAPGAGIVLPGVLAVIVLLVLLLPRDPGPGAG